MTINNKGPANQGGARTAQGVDDAIEHPPTVQYWPCPTVMPSAQGKIALRSDRPLFRWAQGQTLCTFLQSIR